MSLPVLEPGLPAKEMVTEAPTSALGPAKPACLLLPLPARWPCTAWGRSRCLWPLRRAGFLSFGGGLLCLPSVQPHFSLPSSLCDSRWGKLKEMVGELPLPHPQ